MYKKILVPLDGSEMSECIVNHVRAIACGCKVPEVILLKVIDKINGQLYEVPDDWKKEAEKKSKKDSEKYLAEIAGKLKEDGISTMIAVEDGNPADIILKYIEENGIDLVAMSTHGKSGISRFAFGSVSERVIHYAPSPVLIAMPQACLTGDSPRCATRKVPFYDSGSGA